MAEDWRSEHNLLDSSYLFFIFKAFPVFFLCFVLDTRFSYCSLEALKTTSHIYQIHTALYSTYLRILIYSLFTTPAKSLAGLPDGNTTRAQRFNPRMFLLWRDGANHCAQPEDLTSRVHKRANTNQADSFIQQIIKAFKLRERQQRPDKQRRLDCMLVMMLFKIKWL